MSNTAIYVDLDSRFAEHPVKRELFQLTEENAVKESIRNLIMTNFYERPFQPWVGSGVNHQLFEPMTQFTQAQLREAIATVIGNFEPRATVIDISVTPNFENYEFKIVITFSILNKREAITLPILLQRVR